MWHFKAISGIFPLSAWYVKPSDILPTIKEKFPTFLQKITILLFFWWVNLMCMKMSCMGHRLNLSQNPASMKLYNSQVILSFHHEEQYFSITSASLMDRQLQLQHFPERLTYLLNYSINVTGANIKYFGLFFYTFCFHKWINQI